MKIRKYLIIIFIFSILLSLNTLSVLGGSLPSNYENSNVPIYYTYYVDDDNIDGPWEGTKQHPYNKIQDAIDNAYHYNDDIIYVYNGTYKECIVINKSISLIGENKDSTIIDGERKGNTIWVSYNYIKISGFKVINCIDNGFSSGIHVRMKQVQISDCIIESNTCGIRTHHFNNISINNCIIRNNSAHSIYVITTSNITINNCDIYQNGDPAGYSGGISITNSVEYETQSNIVIQNCKIHDNFYRGISVGNGGWDGLGYTNVLIENNEIYNNTRSGILIWESEVFITNNLISKNGEGKARYGGILLENTNSLVKIENNSFKDNNGFGIHFLRSTGNSVKFNDFIGNNRQIGFSYEDSITSRNILIENYYDNLKNPMMKIFLGVCYMRYGIASEKVLPILIFNVEWNPSKEPNCFF